MFLKPKVGLGLEQPSYGRCSFHEVLSVGPGFFRSYYAGAAVAFVNTEYLMPFPYIFSHNHCDVFYAHGFKMWWIRNEMALERC